MTIQDQEIVRQILRQELQNIIKLDRYTFDKNVQILDGRNIQLGRTNGTKIGTETTQMLGFFGATPVVQQTVSGVGSGSTASDGVARAGVNATIALLKSYGLTS